MIRAAPSCFADSTPINPTAPSPTTATVVRVRDGEALVTDGPYLEGKEHLGGFTIVRARDLDAALAWGEKVARATTLPIEVRPFQTEVEA